MVINTKEEKELALGVHLQTYQPSYRVLTKEEYAQEDSDDLANNIVEVNGRRYYIFNI